jgi:uncharacterized membrane protein YuzA (DUF378 family)
MFCLAIVRTISSSLVILGALNWGLVGVIELDLIRYVLGEGSLLGRFIYILIGCAGGFLAIDAFGWKSSCTQTNL